jgi:FMN phosphatase YigB (HAD superfamily)
MTNHSRELHINSLVGKSMNNSSDNISKEIAKVSVAELGCFLENNLNGTRVLSLDCFDTLLWRKLATPTDVFYALQRNKNFDASGMSPVRRSVSESRLRKIRSVQGRSTELTLVDIYKHALPSADEDLIRSLVEEELSTEKDLCIVFQPVFNLLEAAKKLNLKTMVVSDTYLSGQQLKTLIEHCMLKAGVNTAIDYVFASSDWGTSKADGLFTKVLRTVKVSPSRVIHLGDNVHSDHHGARKAGVRGFLFSQFYPSVKSAMSRLARVSQIILPHVRDTYPLMCRWKLAWATTEDNEPSAMVGKYTLGPVLYNFVDWIANHVEQLKRGGEKPRLVFLLRDGHAAYLAAQKFAEIDSRLSDVPITELEASRFVAYASSFTDRNSIVAYLSEHARSPAYEALLTQLLFTGEEIQLIVGRYKRTQNDLARFLVDVLSDHNLKKIVARSAEFRKRFYKRIDKVVGVQKGETLLLVDLGYNGTVHTLLSPLLSADFSVKCLGLFLILNGSAERPGEKHGLIGGEKCDARLPLLLAKHIKVLEQINTSSTASTVGFTDEGLPIYSRKVVPAHQNALCEDIQRHAIQFVSSALVGGVPSITRNAVVDETASLIGRLLFLPSIKEISAFDDAIHDVNLATNQTERLIDISTTNSIVRKRGVGGLIQAERNGVFWELLSRDIDEALHYLTVSRFEVEMPANDNKGQEISVIMHAESGVFQVGVPAYTTKDGFLRILVPVNEKIQALGVMLAKISNWIQVESVSLIGVATAFSAYAADSIGQSTAPCSARYVMGIEHDTAIVQFSDSSGFAFITPADAPEWARGDMACEIVFRPLNGNRLDIKRGRDAPADYLISEEGAVHQ